MVNFDILKRCFLIIRIQSKLPPSLGNGISETLNLKISSGLRPSFAAPQWKRASYGSACFGNMSVRKIMRIFLCKLRLHFLDSKHLRGVTCHEIFGIFFVIHPPQLYMLATALIGAKYKMGYWMTWIKSLFNPLASNTFSAVKLLYELLHSHME
jgi:hypothetical protein